MQNETAPHCSPSIDVSVLRWPAEEELRRQLAWFELPRLLLIVPGGHPPELLDELEDWAHVSAQPADLEARCRTLSHRAREPAPRVPVLDEDGLLWVGNRWVALTGTQVPVARLLLSHLDRVVRFEAIVAAYERAGGSGHPASVRTLVARIGVRVRSVGLDLISVRRRGVILTRPAGPPPQDPSR